MKQPCDQRTGNKDEELRSEQKKIHRTLRHTCEVGAP